MQQPTISNPRDTGSPWFVPCENGNAADSFAAGDVVELELNATAVYPGFSVQDGTVDDPLVRGVVIGASLIGGAIPINTFGVVQVGGFVAGTITTDGSVDGGEILLPAASAVAKGSASDAIGRMGVALAADSSTSLTAAAVLRGLI